MDKSCISGLMATSGCTGAVFCARDDSTSTVQSNVLLGHLSDVQEFRQLCRSAVQCSAVQCSAAVMWLCHMDCVEDIPRGTPMEKSARN